MNDSSTWKRSAQRSSARRAHLSPSPSRQENEALHKKVVSVLSDREASVSKQLDDSSLRSSLPCWSGLIKLQVPETRVGAEDPQERALEERSDQQDPPARPPPPSGPLSPSLRSLRPRQSASSATQDSASHTKAERDELERLWAESQSEVRGLRKRLEESERERELAVKAREEVVLSSPVPPVALSEKGEPALPPSPPRVAGPANSALDTLTKKLRLMSEQLNRIEPSS
jgi:hypothetical protein